MPADRSPETTVGQREAEAAERRRVRAEMGVDPDAPAWGAQTTLTTREERLASLLSEGLDLCVRARALDKVEEDRIETQMRNPHMTKSGTIPLWMAEQYQTDLAEWEAKARKALTDAE
jgi:hypothetical protein